MRRDAYHWNATFSEIEPPDTIGNIAGKPTPIVATPIVATPPKHSMFRTDVLRDAIAHKAGKSTLSVATLIIETPPKDVTFCAGEPLGAI
jgi:hypothetical protein